MARRTTPPKRPNAPDAAPFELLEPTPAAAPRRARKAAPRAAEPDATEALFPGGNEKASRSAAPKPEAPTKMRRGRKAKAEASVPQDDQPAAMAEAEAPAAESEQPDMLAATTAAPSPDPLPTDMPATAGHDETAPAVSWDTSGKAAFDWPGIERVAASEGPNRAMARLLLAARAEGANSRWPFSAVAGS